MSSEPSQASVNIGDSNTGISVSITQNFGGTLESDLKAAVRELEEDITRYSLSIEYSQKLVQAEEILRKIDLQQFLDQIDCRRKPHSEVQKIRALLSFLINTMTIDNTCVPPDNSTTRTIIQNTSTWLFNIPRGEAEKLALHLTDIIQMFSKIPNSEIRDGTIFLSKLKEAIPCDRCVGEPLERDCVRGVVRDWMLGQSGNPFSQEPITDYFSQLEPRNLLIKCGNCIANIQETEKASRLF